MEENMNNSILENVGSNITAAMETDVRTLAMSYLMYKIDNWLFHIFHIFNDHSSAHTLLKTAQNAYC